MEQTMQTAQGAISGKEKVRRYAEGHRKYAKLMFRSPMKDARAMNVTGRFMDMGAGPGFLAMMLAEQHPGSRITAVDVSEDMAELGREYFAEKGLQDRIDYAVGDVCDADFLNSLGKFDFVYSTFSMHHWPDQQRGLCNLCNSVAENGVLYIYDFRRIGWLCSLPLKGGDIASMRKACTADGIKAIFDKAGIQEYRIKSSVFSPFQTIVARKR